MHPCSQVTDCVKYLSRHTYIVSVSVSQSSNVQITFGAEALRMQHEDLNMFVSVFSLHTPVTRGIVWWWGRPSRCTSGWQERRGGRCTSQLRRAAFSKVHSTIALFKVHSTIAFSKIHSTVHYLGKTRQSVAGSCAKWVDAAEDGFECATMCKVWDVQRCTSWMTGGMVLRCSGRWSHTYRSPGLLSNGPHSHPPFISIPTGDSDTKLKAVSWLSGKYFCQIVLLIWRAVYLGGCS